MKLVIYMPVLNEEEGILETLKALPKKIEGISEIQYLVVDDGSTDNSVKLATDFGAKVVSHGFNRGVGAAFQTALKEALKMKADILVSVDADRQFNVDQIPDIIQPILKGEANMVTGNRFEKGIPEHMPKTKYWGNIQMSRLISIISGKYFRDVSCGFRAYDREAMLNLNLFGEFTYTQETILDIVYKGLKVIEFPVDVIYYPSRKSRVAGSIIKYATRTSKIIIKTLRDYRPMLFFGGMGLISGLIGMLFEIFLFIHYFSTGEFTPFKFLGFLGAGFIILGLFLLIVGLLADMFNRIRINQERIIYQMKKDKNE